jgi:Ca2+-binding RTX toxin-like protein
MIPLARTAVVSVLLATALSTGLGDAAVSSAGNDRASGAPVEIHPAGADPNGPPARLVLKGRSAAEDVTIARAGQHLVVTDGLGISSQTCVRLGPTKVRCSSEPAKTEVLVDLDGGDDRFELLNRTAPYGGLTVYGRDGDDTIMTKGGYDWADGDGGDDTIRTGDGYDVVAGGPGSDRLFSGDGRDLIYANSALHLKEPGPNNVLDCGPGSPDTVVPAADDVPPRHCERRVSAEDPT